MELRCQLSRLKSDGRAYTNALQGWPSILLNSNQQVGHCGQGCRSFSEYCCQWCSQQQCPVLKSNGCLYTWKNTNHVAIKEIRVYGQSKKCSLFVFYLFIWVLRPVKIISLILSRANHLVGWKNTWPDASRTWLVSHVTWARLEPTVVRWRAEH